MDKKQLKNFSEIFNKFFAKPVPILRDYAQSASYVKTTFFEDASPPLIGVDEYILGTTFAQGKYSPPLPVPENQYVHQLANAFFVCGRVFTPEGAYLVDNIRIRRKEVLESLYIGDIENVCLGNELFAMAPSLPAGANPEVLRIDEPCMPFSDPGYKTKYGHFLLENMPQLWILSKGYKPKLLLHPDSASVPGYILDWVKPFGLDEGDFIIPNYASVCKELYVPSRPYMHQGYMSAYAKAVWSMIAQFYTKNDKRYDNLKIYISRAKQNRRKLVNEADCEQLFKNNGFRIICPEDIPMQEQINIFSRASHIAGPIGAGLHNVVFSRNRKLKVLFLNPLGFHPTNAYKNIEYAFGRAIYTVYGEYLFPGPENAAANPFADPWVVDMESLEQGLMQWLK